MNSIETPRERILKAAFELISSRGYLGASTREIAQHAHVAEITLFRQFANKESLFAEVLRSFSSIPALTELVPQLKLQPFEEALETLTFHFLDRLEINRSWIHLLSYEVNHAPDEMKNVYGDFLKQLFSVLTDFFTDARERGVIRSDLNPEYAARAFHSLVFGFFHIEGTFRDTAGLKLQNRDLINSFVKILCRGTQPDVASKSL